MSEAGLDRLRAVVDGMGSVLVTLSGGVDSALVAHVAHQQLGDRAVALTAHSESLPAEEAADAAAVAAGAGIRHVVVRSHELEREGYRANAGNRCYFCKTELFGIAEERRQELGLDWVADGTVLDDLGDHRPGLRAAGENRVRHPLVEADLRKDEVRAIARSLDIAVWDKPAFACLGSRFPAGTPVTADKLQRVERAESALRRFGLRKLRVRWHELRTGRVLARIEVQPDDIAVVTTPGVREQIVAACLAAGFDRVTLDLVGYPR